MKDAHAYQHQLIDERWAAYRSLPKRGNGMARYRRREAFKRYWWTLTGHVQSFHRDAMKQARLHPSAPFLRMTETEVEQLHRNAHLT